MAQSDLNDSAFTSSLNHYFLCNWCSEKFHKKEHISDHMITCIPYLSAKQKHEEDGYLRCKICNQEFGNRGALVCHVTRKHENKIPPRKNTTGTLRCHVCTRFYSTQFGLRLHIRRNHFNMRGKIPYYQQKKVNQVWFEKVINCNNVIEIKKTAPNRLVMRRLNESSAIKVVDHNEGIVDVSDVYPVYGKSAGKKDKQSELLTPQVQVSHSQVS